ncbi:hypothetical protein FQA39_LY13705 [Lamprigera yunnana]|nr:hypothetical protein FQA39_LY13705 [Lamprigera yunnana]
MVILSDFNDVRATMAVSKIYVKSQQSKEELNKFSAHNLIKKTIIFAQCFALLPLSGISLEVTKVSFQWLSLKTVYTLTTIVLLFVYTISILIYTIINSDNFFNFVVVVWNLRALLGIVLFLKISLRWPQLMKFWTAVENSMLNYGKPPNLKFKYVCLTIIYLVTGILEHAAFLTAGIKKIAQDIEPSESYVRKYYVTLFSEFFHIFEYTHWKAVFVEIHSDEYWRGIRKDYNNLTLLCKFVNDTIGQLVVLAFSGNLYFLSVSVLQCLTPRRGFDVVYVWYGMCFTSSHFFLLCWHASSVYEESFQPISELVGIPTKYVSHEVLLLLF